jgi:hypothetical protein
LQEAKRKSSEFIQEE